MFKSQSMLKSAVAVGLLVTGYSWAAEPATQDLQSQIQELKTKVAELEARQYKTADVDATVRQILNDADRRSQMMSSEGFTAGYDSTKGFVLRDTEGNYVLHPFLQFDPRYVYNNRSDAKTTGNDETQSGFEIRRMKFGFDGNFISPKFTYQFQWNTAQTNKTSTVPVTDSTGAQIGTVTDTTTAGGTPVLEEALVKFQFADQWAVQGGQFKDPVSKEGYLSSARNLAVDKSIVSNFFFPSDVYVQGVDLIYENADFPVGPFRAQWAMHDGIGQNNNDFQDYTYAFGTAVRAEWMVIGKNWKPYGDFTALGNKEDMLVFGAGVDWSQADGSNTGSFTALTDDVITYTVDVSWKPQAINGLAMYAGYVARRYSTQADGGYNAAGDDSATDYGFVAQAAYVVDKNWEPFVRWSTLNLDDKGPYASIANVQDSVQEYALGVNYYIKGHNAKFTADIVYLPDGYPSGLPSASGLGILSQTPVDGDYQSQFALRVQFQLLL